MLSLKQPFILPFLCHKSATTCQIDSYKVSTSKLKPDLRNCARAEIIESMAPPQQRHKRAQFFWDTLCDLKNSNCPLLNVFSFFTHYQKLYKNFFQQSAMFQIAPFVVLFSDELTSFASN